MINYNVLCSFLKKSKYFFMHIHNQEHKIMLFIRRGQNMNFLWRNDQKNGKKVLNLKLFKVLMCGQSWKKSKIISNSMLHTGFLSQNNTMSYLCVVRGYHLINENNALRQRYIHCRVISLIITVSGFFLVLYRLLCIQGFKENTDFQSILKKTEVH